MIHLHGIWYAERPKRSDVRVSQANRAAIKADLTSTKLEKDSREPRHFAERQSYLQQGGE